MIQDLPLATSSLRRWNQERKANHREEKNRGTTMVAVMPHAAAIARRQQSQSAERPENQTSRRH